ncbi:MAG TPA: helix-turn-helix domain-containing protein [Bacteroidetes bacterium]|nr:helix-turn-helix domain-containing protein [Bacteroidota bacterium]
MGRTSTLTDSDKKTIKDLALQGLTYGEIMERTGKSRSAVYYFLRSNGLRACKAQGTHMSEQERKAAIKLAREGYSALEIAAVLKRKKNTVWRFLNRYGVKTRSSHRRITEENLMMFSEMTSKGMTRQDAAAALGMSLNSIESALQVYGYPWEQERSAPGPVSTERKDPRSRVCQQISVCSHRRCHRHLRCPAFHAWMRRVSAG